MSWTEMQPEKRQGAAAKAAVRFGIGGHPRGSVTGLVTFSKVLVAERGFAKGQRFRVKVGGGNHVGMLRIEPDEAGGYVLAILRGAGVLRIGCLPGMTRERFAAEGCAFAVDPEDGAIELTLPRWWQASVAAAPRVLPPGHPRPAGRPQDVTGSLMGDPPPGRKTA